MTERPDACPRCGYALDQPPAPEGEREALHAPATARSAAQPAAVDLPRYPAPASTAASTGPRLTVASVPRILLGLGATCLLVAAVIFLAVAWSWLGIGGRTAVLVALTAATGAGGQWLARRDLRVSAEALTTVALGLLVLDLVGAAQAGWLGSPEDGSFAALVGGILLGVSLTLLLPPRPLVVPQLAAPLGLAVLAGGVAVTTQQGQLCLAVAVIGYAALALLARRVRVAVLPWAALAMGVYGYLFLLVAGLVEATGLPTLRALWLEGNALWLVVSALLALLPWALFPRHDALRQLTCSGSVLILTGAAAVPVLDEGATAVTLAAASAVVAWSLLAASVPARWSVVPRVPLAGALIALAPAPAVLAAQGVADLVLVADPFTASAGVRLDPQSAYADPWLLPLAALAGVLAALLALPRVAWRGRSAAGVLVTAGLLTAAHHPLPLWLFVAACALGGALLLADSLRDTVPTRVGEAAVAAGLMGLGAVLALPSAVLTTVLLAEVVVAAAAVLVRRFEAVEPVAGPVLPAALACLVWTAGHLAEAPLEHRSLAVVAVIGLLALVVPRLELEVVAVACSLVASAAGVGAAADGSVSAAIHLTLGGALVTASALVHRDRRPLGWPGGLLLAAATWVRLADIGVQQPEAYTLPAATVLVLLGLARLHSDHDADTLRLVGPGLSLATVPSLLWVFADPVSTRAVLLGLACLLLLLSGTALRWTAPVLVGWVVGGLVVLRELAPYAATTPQWVLIGTAGTLLIGVGVTWEGRRRDLRDAAAYLGKLR